MKGSARILPGLLIGWAALGTTAASGATRFEEARIYIEYNATDNDLGFHVSLDGEDWRSLKIVNPAGNTILDMNGRGPYQELGLTELFFEGAEPSLDDVPLADLLARFPEGRYRFVGVTVDGERIAGSSQFSHAVPAGPVVSSMVDDGEVVIGWEPVSAPPPGFPGRPIRIVAYQVIVDPFQVTLPASSRQVTLPAEFVESLAPGTHGFEVLAIDESGNQTITAGAFETE